MNNKTISVAMATYNGARFIRKQLDSLYSQTRIPDEVVVCDDNSTDGTQEILQEYKEKKGLRYYINTPALGVNQNFYKAISLCTSDYIAICDQDDIWLPNKIEVTYRKLLEIDNGMPCVVSSQCNHIDAEDNIISESPDEPDNWNYSDTFLTIGKSQGCSLMLNRELTKIVLNYSSCVEIEDTMYDAFISFTAAILGLKYNLGKRLMLYRHHDSNVVSFINQSNESFRQKLKRRWLLYGLMPNERIKSFSVLNDLYGDQVSSPDIRIFLQQAGTLYRHNTLGERIRFVYKRKELSFSRRLKVIIQSMIVGFVIKLV